jgi:hypothetical protein
MLDVIKGLESAPVNLSADEISAPALLEALTSTPLKHWCFVTKARTCRRATTSPK